MPIDIPKFYIHTIDLFSAKEQLNIYSGIQKLRVYVRTHYTD